MDNFRAFLHSLSPISDATWTTFSALFRTRQLAKGEFFVVEGEFSQRIGFLEQGVVRAFVRDGEGREYNKHLFVPPCFLGGYASLITGRPSQIMREALTDCWVYEANFREYESLFDQFPQIERVARHLAEQFFVAKEQREIELVLWDATKRYAHFQARFPELEQLIPQYHIASYLGITPIQLSRIRRKARSTS